MRVARVSGLCASRGCPGTPPRGVSEANDAKGGEGAASARPKGQGPLRAKPAGDRTRAANPSTHHPDTILAALR